MENNRPRHIPLWLLPLEPDQIGGQPVRRSPPPNIVCFAILFKQNLSYHILKF